MLFAFKTKKSAGIRVTRTVHRLISEGDAARDAGDWPGAISAYGLALARAPDLHHIRIQFGHALKEDGRLDEADLAYAEAVRGRPDDIEPIRLRAHLAKDRGETADALDLFGKLLDSAGRDDATNAINGMIGAAPPLPANTLAQLLGEACAASADEELCPGDTAIRPLLFDLTDLVDHIRSHRLPTGIQRVQIELTLAALRAPGPADVDLCGLLPERAAWVGIPAERFTDIARLATAGGEIDARDWQMARARLLLDMMTAGSLDIRPGAILLTTDSSARVLDYFRFVRNARERLGLSYIPFVHDLIPVIMPEHFVPGVVEDFVGWLNGAIRHADAFLTNSRSTRADLLGAARQLGHPIPEDRIEAIPLDADFRRRSDPLPPSTLLTWGLNEDTPFVLMVSTIEPRKNHLLAFEAWARLIDRHGAIAVPRLVCVGRNGWLNGAAFARLEGDPALRSHVTLIERASDAELALLYQTCAFTVYPSLYEGWGLPVTESLSYGKIALFADNSSLPEAGGSFGVPFASNDPASLVAALERLIFDIPWRGEREAAIATGFAPRSWQDLEKQLHEAVLRLAGTAPVPVDRSIRPNLYYPIGVQRSAQLWQGLGSGEIFRTGDNWLWPETDGCRTTLRGGELRIGITTLSTSPLRLCLLLKGLSRQASTVSVTVDGREAALTKIDAGVCRWVFCDLPSEADGELSVIVRGDAQEAVTQSICGTDLLRLAAIGVVGFLIDDGSDARVVAALQHPAADDPALLSAYRQMP